MSRKRAMLLAGLAIGLAVFSGGSVWLLAHQPAFYRAALSPRLSPDERIQLAEGFVRSVVQLRNGIHNNDERWSQEFPEQAINCWLAEELPAKYAAWLPAGVSDPRVQFEEGGGQIAFRTRHGVWSGIVSCRLKVWAAGPNELAIDVRSLRAGLIPIPLDEVVGNFVTALNESGWRIQWKQSAGDDVLVVSLDDSDSAGETAPQAVLEAIEFLPGKLRVAGRRQKKGLARTAGRLELPPQTGGTGEVGVK